MGQRCSVCGNIYFTSTGIMFHQWSCEIEARSRINQINPERIPFLKKPGVRKGKVGR
jgi:hypothetical protein